MKRIASVFYLLISTNMRSGFIEKARDYGRVAYALFPNDRRIAEIYGYALLLSGDYDEADALLAGRSEETPNTAYLKTRVALSRGGSPGAAGAAARAYLAAS